MIDKAGFKFLFISHHSIFYKYQLRYFPKSAVSADFRFYRLRVKKASVRIICDRGLFCFSLDCFDFQGKSLAEGLRHPHKIMCFVQMSQGNVKI